ncbi:MAG: hypothetical protein LBP22_16720 [Deltaproteobacteria bacterium]|jgi:hypothetical protein|nr:hypothetical protein [Deltaproteobacteria bacterium]
MSHIRRSLLSGLVLSLLLTGCIGKSQRLQAVYQVQPGRTLNPGTVQLLVQDRRNSPDLIGPEAMAKDIFQASQGGQLDLVTETPAGSRTQISQLTVSQAVWEAVRQNLALLGINAVTGTSGAKARVTVTIETLSLELSGREVIARVNLSANIDRPGLPNSYQTRGFGQSNSTHLFGDQGGSDAISEAFTLALNNLDFSGLNNFQ